MLWYRPAYHPWRGRVPAETGAPQPVCSLGWTSAGSVTATVAVACSPTSGAAPASRHAEPSASLAGTCTAGPAACLAPAR